MVFHWRADDGPTLNAGLVFQGFQTSIAKKPYIFVIFQGGTDPLSLPLDPLMNPKDRFSQVEAQVLDRRKVTNLQTDNCLQQ